MINTFDAIVFGGGMLGSAIGFGLVREGLTTAILDEGDMAFRAARGNFGLLHLRHALGLEPSRPLGAPSA